MINAWSGLIDADLGSSKLSSRGESKTASGSLVRSSMVEESPAGVIPPSSDDATHFGSTTEAGLSVDPYTGSKSGSEELPS